MGILLLDDYLAAHYHNRPIEDHPVCEIRLLFHIAIVRGAVIEPAHAKNPARATA
jgi:hypothetical protein